MIVGEITEREYWAQRASDVGAAGGRELTLREYMSLLYDPPSEDLIRPSARQTVEHALAAGVGVSILTNDMRAFHGREWENGIEFLTLVDHVVDCSDTDILKPDPRAFARTTEIIGVGGRRVLFVDDQPTNVAGAEKVGLTAMWFDIANATESWGEVADRLGV
jgi:putative hydrolase of the HAD superfamily